MRVCGAGQLLLVVLAAQTAIVESASAQTAEQVDAAVAKGVAYLWKQQGPDGHFPPYRQYPGGYDVTAMAALIYAGESFEKPEMVRAFKSFTELELGETYTLGFRLIAMAERYRRAPDPKVREGLRAHMKLDAEKLAGFQHSTGPWDYRKSTGEWDFSNTQIAILALQQAVLCGVEVNRDVFLRAQQFYLDKQRADGGWNYSRAGRDRGGDAPSYGSMTAAAVANLFIIRDLLDPGQGCPCKGDRSTGNRNGKVQAAIDRGVKWLGDNFTLDNPGCQRFPDYWLYSVERVGIASGFKYLGSHNWYAEGATQLLTDQRGDGFWSGGFGGVPDTACALLFLIKGRGPILLNKLQYQGDWDLHPRDAANLARYVGESKEQPFLWQVINLDVPVAEMHDAPILYISTESALKLSDDHKKKLREFTDSGGVILFEASCGNRAADTWIRKTCTELWPEWELKIIDKDHPLWSADVKIVAPPSYLQGISDGLRTFLFYAPRDVSCAWNTGGVTRNKALFDLGGNLYTYSTDRAKLRGRLVQREVGTGQKYAAQKPACGDRKAITVARVKHGGEWYVGKNYHPWQLLGAEARAKAGLEIQELDPVAPGSAIAAGTSLLYLNGRTNCDLGGTGAAWLKEYLAGGGFLFAEAALGDRRFVEPLTAALAAAGLTFKALAADSALLSGHIAGATGYAVDKVAFTYALRGERIDKPEPELLGIYLGDKLVGIFSPFDIMYRQTGCAAWDCRGYETSDASALAMNIALWCSAR